MEHLSLWLILSCVIVSCYAWSVPFYPVHAVQRVPHRFIRHVRHVHPPLQPQPYRIPVPVMVRDSTSEEKQQRQQRPKRDHDYDHDHSDHDRSKGVTGPVHTFVKTDKNANYKWGVRHHVGNKFAT